MATILVSGGPPINLYSVIWNGKRWITGGQDSSTSKSYIFVSHDGINWYESPPLTTPPNPYNNPINNMTNNMINDEDKISDIENSITASLISDNKRTKLCNNETQIYISLIILTFVLGLIIVGIYFLIT